MLERMFVIPGINQPVGLDVILDLVPVRRQHRRRRARQPTSRGKRATSACRNGRWRGWPGNIGFDLLLGLIPLVGAIPDFFFRSNTRNLRIIKRHLDKHHPAHRRRSRAPLPGASAPSADLLRQERPFERGSKRVLAAVGTDRMPAFQILVIIGLVAIASSRRRPSCAHGRDARGRPWSTGRRTSADSARPA